MVRMTRMFYTVSKHIFSRNSTHGQKLAPPALNKSDGACGTFSLTTNEVPATGSTDLFDNVFRRSEVKTIRVQPNDIYFRVQIGINNPLKVCDKG
jgi:hypothetical protein